MLKLHQQIIYITQVYTGIYNCPHPNDDNVDNLFVKELQRASEHPNGPRLLISGTVGKEQTLTKI